METVYNYGEMSEDSKKTAAEIIDILAENSDTPTELLCEVLRQKFRIKTIPIRPVEHSIWHEFTHDEPLGQNIQGFIQTGTDLEAKRVPYLGFSADLNQLDAFILRLINKVQGIDVEEINNRSKEYQNS